LHCRCCWGQYSEQQQQSGLPRRSAAVAAAGYYLLRRLLLLLLPQDRQQQGQLQRWLLCPVHLKVVWLLALHHAVHLLLQIPLLLLLG
jgi:hypothetical protein